MAFDGRKYIEVGDLEDILSKFPTHYRLIANSAGNISIYNHDDFIGYIDILDEEFEPWIP
jgi:hypothetical protein